MWINLCISFFMILIMLFQPLTCLARIYVDINSPAIHKFNIAITDFKDLGDNPGYNKLFGKLADVISNDLDLSGYFSPMDKGAFLNDNKSSLALDSIRFKNWSVIGAELLLQGGVRSIGRTLQVECRLFDVFWGRQILGKRALGETRHYRYLMHRLGNEIVQKLTGHPGIFTTKIAFVSNESGNKEIHISDYDGHNVKKVTADRSIALLPRISPDGKKIIYTSFKDGGAMLYLKDLSSGSVRKISYRSGLNTGASWAPDGSRLALTLSSKGNPDVFLIDLHGKIQRQLTNHWGIDVSPSFSTDGKEIAFISNRSGSPQVYIGNLTNNNVKRLTFEGKYNTCPSWSALNQIAFASMRNGTFDICVMDPDGNNLKRLTENQGNNEDPCWSPDGREPVVTIYIS